MDAKTIADKYVGRDGSEVGSRARSTELTRAAVSAAQKAMAAELGRPSPLSDRQMHRILAEAIKAAPEVFPPHMSAASASQ